MKRFFHKLGRFLGRFVLRLAVALTILSLLPLAFRFLPNLLQLGQRVRSASVVIERKLTEAARL